MILSEILSKIWWRGDVGSGPLRDKWVQMQVMKLEGTKKKKQISETNSSPTMYML